MLYVGGEVNIPLQKATLPIVDNDLCRSLLGRQSHIRQNDVVTEDMICAGFEAGKDACFVSTLALYGI